MAGAVLLMEENFPTQGAPSSPPLAGGPWGEAPVMCSLPASLRPHPASSSGAGSLLSGPLTLCTAGCSVCFTRISGRGLLAHPVVEETDSLRLCVAPCLESRVLSLLSQWPALGLGHLGRGCQALRPHDTRAALSPRAPRGPQGGGHGRCCAPGHHTPHPTGDMPTAALFVCGSGSSEQMVSG